MIISSGRLINDRPKRGRLNQHEPSTNYSLSLLRIVWIWFSEDSTTNPIKKDGGIVRITLTNNKERTITAKMNYAEIERKFLDIKLPLTQNSL